MSEGEGFDTRLEDAPVGGDSPITAKLTTAEAAARLVLSLLAPHENCPALDPNPCSWIFFSVRVGPEFFISCWLWNHWKVAAGLDSAKHVRLKSEPDWMNWGGLGGAMVTSSGPSTGDQREQFFQLH